MKDKIVIFGLFLLGVHNAVSLFEDDDIQFILDYDGSRQTTVHNLKKAVRLLLQSDDPESIAVTFHNTDVKIWHISIRSDYDYASNDNPGVMSMTGILKALRHSPPESPLWLFTDKPVKDPVKYQEVVYRSQQMGNPIYFAIFGPRNHSVTPEPGFSMYHDVATATNGQVFYLQKNETGELLNYEECLRSRPKDIYIRTISPELENNEFSVTVDSKMSELLITLTGEDEVPEVTLSDPSGAVATTDVTRLSAITVVKSPVSPGRHFLHVSRHESRQESRVVVTAFTSLTFRHGFSAHTPTDFNETSKIPVPGTAYISILLDDDEGLQLRTVQILDMQSTVLVEEPVKSVLSVNDPSHFYTTDPISIPDQTFQIAINIHNESSGTYLTRHGSTPITPSLSYKCLQPKNEGLCEGALPMWFFDNAIKECRPFVYGGCYGNENRFPTEAECARECWASAPPEPPSPKIGGDTGISTTSHHSPSPRPENAEVPSAEGTCADWTCGNNQCIHHSWLCDGMDDCGDNSDEVGCNDICQQPMDVGPCRAELPRWYYDSSLNMCRRFVFGGCQGNANHFYSEAHCKLECAAPAPPTPPTPEIGGDTGYGIPRIPASKSNICDEKEFACSRPFLTPFCISVSSVCDGDIDCPQGEDEDIDKCRNHQCPPDMFRCPSGRCLLQSRVCNGYNDCSDTEASDEQNCTTSHSHHWPPPRPENAEVPSAGGPCLSWMVTCGNNKCIPHWWRCDGMNDCGDNSDEVGCENAKCHQPMDPGTCRAKLKKWYYNNIFNTCLPLWYGGCGGNDNRFDTEAECRGLCVERNDEPTQTTTEQQNREPAATETTPKVPMNEIPYAFGRPNGADAARVPFSSLHYAIQLNESP